MFLSPREPVVVRPPQQQEVQVEVPEQRHTNLHPPRTAATFEQEQQRVGFEKASADKLLLKYLLPALDVPNWGLLDPVNEFVTSAELETTGWSGEKEKIVMFHMLQGDSD